MATIDGVDGLTAEILVNGVALANYDPPEEDIDEDLEKTTTKYIEAQPGANFQINININREYKHRYCDLLISVILDGNQVENIIARKERFQNFTTCTTPIDSHSYYTGSAWRKRKFLFSKLVLDENSTKRADTIIKNQMANLGRIELKLYRTVVIQEYSPVAAEGTVREHFLLLIRSTADLQAKMIIPRSPTPVPLEERAVDELTPEEMRELLVRQRKREARDQLARVRIKSEFKRERKDTTSDDDVEVLQQPPRKRIKAAETIDLTGDSD
ncbi:hypothetical protein EJ08DRAFT_683937 [Tothia fuscella]|uniref:DUF7918 domain-containing protein n=1 Tax=Tothia fuscella TaxID=1048955 RepID=A0A9P4NF43_9PEZI|nr:hypothetical protein EJ08DRAFT_683937 [Tothia fuscella]